MPQQQIKQQQQQRTTQAQLRKLYTMLVRKARQTAKEHNHFNTCEITTPLTTNIKRPVSTMTNT
jgi:hypothetical protein